MPNGEQEPPTESEERLAAALLCLVECWDEVRDAEEGEYVVQTDMDSEYWIALLKSPIPPETRLQARPLAGP